MMDEYMLDQINEDEDAYEVAEKRKKKAKKLLLTTFVIETMLGNEYFGEDEYFENL